MTHHVDEDVPIRMQSVYSLLCFQCFSRAFIGIYTFIGLVVAERARL